MRGTVKSWKGLYDVPGRLLASASGSFGIENRLRPVRGRSSSPLATVDFRWGISGSTWRSKKVWGGRKEDLVWERKRERRRRLRVGESLMLRRQLQAGRGCLHLMFDSTPGLPTPSFSLFLPFPGLLQEPQGTPLPWGSRPELECQSYIPRQRQHHLCIAIYASESPRTALPEGSCKQNDMLWSLWLLGSAFYHAGKPRKPVNIQWLGNGAVRFVSTSTQLCL